MVGPLPRQAEDRHVHAAGQGARRAARRPRSCARSARSRTATAAATASSRRARTSSSTGSSSAKLPDVFARPRAPRASRPPAAAATPCATSPAAPSPGSPPTSSSTPTPIVDEAAELFYGNPDYVEPAAQAQVSRSPPAPTAATRPRSTASRCRRGARRARGLRRARRRRALLGAADRARPRRLRPEGGGGRGARARSLDAWRRTSSYRVSRVKARLKFMVDDIGPGGDARARRGAARPQLEDYALPPIDVEPSRPPRRARRRSRRASRTSACPVHLGLDLRRPDDRARRPRRALRRRHPPHAPAELHRHRASRTTRSTRPRPRSTAIGFPLDVNPLRGERDRLHRRAALQLLGRRDEDAARTR